MKSYSANQISDAGGNQPVSQYENVIIIVQYHRTGMENVWKTENIPETIQPPLALPIPRGDRSREADRIQDTW